jgi:lipopolysaccharide/colanic/teichoic acid biosynthesis glycosyltransferase
MSELAQTPVLGSLAVTGAVTPWSVSTRKRVFDAIVAGCALVVASPVMAIIALLVRGTSRGPALFRQVRVGQGGRRFTIFKFRSMRVRTERDSCLTRCGDSRVTALGRILRKTKLDELPQLYNVLRGDMSMVGPRPDMPEYVATLPAHLRTVVLLKPGVTSSASILFRNEEKLLAHVPPEKLHEFYCDTLFPRKVQLDLEYAHSASFLRDLKLIVKTAGVLFRK